MSKEESKITGIYIAYPTSPILKSIYKPKNYKTQVNDQHTKVGIAKDSFESRKAGYVANFDQEVEFTPIARIPVAVLEDAERAVLSAVRSEYQKVGRAREWFQTTNRERLKAIVFETLAAIGCPHEKIG